MSLNSPGSPLRLSNLATTPSPTRSNRSTPSPPIRRRRTRRRARTTNFNNLPIRTPTSPASPLQDLNELPTFTTSISPASPLEEFNGSPIFTTAGQSPIFTTFSNEENGLINTPPPSPPRLTRSGPARRRINFNSPVYNVTRKSRPSTFRESLMSRENLLELQRRRGQLVSHANRAPHNLASNFDSTIPVVPAKKVIHPVNIQLATPARTLENHYAPLAIARGNNVPNTVLPAYIVNEIRKKRKQRTKKKFNKVLKNMLRRKRSGGTKKRNNKNKRNTKKNRRNNRKK